MSEFAAIGENIHCTRIVKLGGKHTVDLPGGGSGVAFRYGDTDRVLPIPADWAEFSPAFGDGKIKHVALAIHQALNGSAEDGQTGRDYLLWAAQRQVDAGANYLDVNVDEYSNDPAQRIEIMRWLAGLLSENCDLPLSIDSSSRETMVAGLEACRKNVGPAMVNSVSLERVECVDVVAQFDAVAVVSAAGKADLPTDVDGRLANFEKIIEILTAAGVGVERMHLDPLVFPVSTDPMHGKNFLAATAAAKKRFGAARLSGGLSNVSFGMPQRKLLNMAFTRLCIDRGASSGIIDPVQMPPSVILAMDDQAEPFRLAAAFLTGEDMFGMEFIAAHRDGRLAG